MWLLESFERPFIVCIYNVDSICMQHRSVMCVMDFVIKLVQEQLLCKTEAIISMMIHRSRPASCHPPKGLFS